MASIRERTLSSGEQVWAVLFRQGKRQGSKTFSDPSKAQEFLGSIGVFGIDRALRILNEEVREDGLTLDEVAKSWLKWKDGRVTPRTFADYRRDYENWVSPHFGHRAADYVTEAEVQRWVDQMATTLSPKSVADRHMILSSIYKYGSARVRGLVTHNPCLETEMPARRHGRPTKGTTLVEWELILNEAMKRKAHDAHDLILFMGSVGWRWSEAAALAVRDVTDDGDIVSVEVTRVFRIVDNRQVLVEDVAKSEAGFRKVPVLNDAATAMLRRRVVGKAPGDYVFTNRRGRHWNQNTFLRNTWPSVAEPVFTDGRKPTPHWLRHMAVGILSASGLNLEQIRRYIGHEDSGTTTKVYGGMMGGLSPELVANARAVFAGTRREGFVVSGVVLNPDPEAGLLSGVQPHESGVYPILGETE